MKTGKFALNSVYAKLRCMYGERLTAKDYSELIRLGSVGEIAQYLKTKTAYSKIFEGYSSEGEMPRSMLENLLFKKQCGDLLKIIRYQRAAGSQLYEHFITMYDLRQIIDVLGSLAVESENYFFSFPVFYNEISHLDLYALAKVRKIEQVPSVTRGTPYEREVRNAVSEYLMTGDLTLVEARLRDYTDESFIRLVEGKGKTELQRRSAVGGLYKFVSDARLIKNLLRLDEFGNAPQLKKTLGSVRITAFTNAQLKRLLEASGREQILDCVRTTYLKSAVPESVEEDVFAQIDAAVVKRCESALRRSNDADTVTLAYFILLDNEIRNIIHIIEGVRYGLSSLEIAPLLTVGAKA